MPTEIKDAIHDFCLMVGMIVMAVLIIGAIAVLFDYTFTHIPAEAKEVKHSWCLQSDGFYRECNTEPMDIQYLAFQVMEH